MSWQTMNLNDKVRVKLKDSGREMLIWHWMGGDCPYQSREAAMKSADICNKGWRGDGWVEFHLWDMANIFGSKMTMGFDPPIETEIQHCADIGTIA